MTPQTAFSNCYHSHLNLTLLEVMWSSQASQKALTAIRAAAFWMGTLMCSTDVNTGASTRSGERERESNRPISSVSIPRVFVSA